jgi:hypothetical protein
MPQINDVFTNRTIDGSSDPFNCTGGPVVVFVSGTYNGARILMEYSLDNAVTWFCDDVYFASDNFEETVPPVNAQMRIRQDRSVAGTSITVKVYR